MSSVDIAELRSLFLFEGLSAEQLAWVAARAEVRAFDTGAAVYREGEPADALWVLLEGGLRLSRWVAGEDVTTNETSHRGAYAGAVRAYAGGVDAGAAPSPQTHQTSMVATQPSRFLRLPAADFATLMREWFPMAVHLLDGLYLGVRNSEATVRQREHLAQLGQLAANLAHELNNPAAATVRATAQLRTRVAGMRHKLGLIVDQDLDRALLARLLAAQEAAVERAAKQRAPLTAIEESDLEDALSERLDALGVAGSYELAPVFAAAGLDPAWLAEVASEAGPDAQDGALCSRTRWRPRR